MFGTAIIVFREALEAVLVVSIVLASCRGAPGRWFWVGAGITGGLLGAGVVALFAGTITSAMAGIGQELLNASILFLAVVMLAWHSIWMSSHARELPIHVKATGTAVAEGSKPLYAIVIVVGAAVLREGAETVLFLMGAGTEDDASRLGFVLAGGAGAVVAVFMGVGLYAGYSAYRCATCFQ